MSPSAPSSSPLGGADGAGLPSSAISTPHKQYKITRRGFLCTIGLAGLGLGLRSGPSATEKAPLQGVLGEQIVGLEIGTSKICMVVAQRQCDGTVVISAVYQEPSRGVAKGRVVDASALQECLSQLFANRVTGVRRLRLAVPRICQGTNGLTERDDLVEDRIRCINKLGIDVKKVVSGPIATAEAVLNDEHKRRGALVIDLGAGTTDYAVYADGRVRDRGSIPLGGASLTNDFAIVWGLSDALAEKLKIEEAYIRLGRPRPGVKTLVFERNGYLKQAQINLETMNAESRVRGLFEMVKESMRLSQRRLDALRTGLHLTGGCSNLPGIGILARKMFRMSVRLARLRGVSMEGSELANAPQWTCAIGLTKI